MRRRKREFYIGIVQASWKSRTRLSDSQCDMGEYNLLTARRTAKLPYLDGE
ncbi:hypothetical protein T11_258 [Trichinella zimbabwensis]|uniref:Uncharacterized protein n=1 Tax=Trichinella zimbabwensis TaxID=268475 RepID=A0A0V1GHE8_9BILA|nr:hypothetical protein T11_258 [Trichinella zimbabwensis]